MKANQFLTIIALLIFGYGCAVAPAVLVPDAEGVETVSAIGMGCKKPWVLVDCSIFSGPKKSIEINGVAIKVAGTEDGKTTVMFGSRQGKDSNVAYEVMKRILVERDIEITSVTPIVSAGIVFGYAIDTAQPAYTVWDEFATE